MKEDELWITKNIGDVLSGKEIVEYLAANSMLHVLSSYGRACERPVIKDMDHA